MIREACPCSHDEYDYYYDIVSSTLAAWVKTAKIDAGTGRDFKGAKRKIEKRPEKGSVKYV